MKNLLMLLIVVIFCLPKTQSRTIKVKENYGATVEYQANILVEHDGRLYISERGVLVAVLSGAKWSVFSMEDSKQMEGLNDER